MSGRDLRIKPDEGLIETVTGITQYGRARDDWGNWFGNDTPPLSTGTSISCTVPPLLVTKRRRP